VEQAEIFLRRALIIVLQPTVQGGYLHPKLREGFDRYRQLLETRSLSQDEISRHFEELAKEAGFDAEGYRQLNEKLYGRNTQLTTSVVEHPENPKGISP
jgi:hypothetical protein